MKPANMSKYSKQGPAMRKWLPAVVLIVGLMPGCERATRTVGSGQAPQTGMISKVELRDKLDRFESFFISTMKQTAEDIDAAGGTRRAERTNLQMQLRCVEALNAMMASDDSVIAFLDTWGLMTRLQIYFKEGPGKSIFGPQQGLAIAFIDASVNDIERIAQLFLSQEQFEESRKNINDFARQNPIGGSFANLVVYATKIKKEEVGVFLKTLSIPMAPIRAMEGMDNTAVAIQNIRDSVERFTDVAGQMPESTRWQMSILMDDFEESEMTQSLLKSLDDFSQSSAKLVEVLNAMPQQLRTELLTVLAESDQSQQQLQITIQTAAETAVQLEKTLGEFQKATLAVNETSAQAAEAAAAWQNASDSIQKLVSMFQNDTPRSPDAPPSFGMRDFDTMLLNAGQTADKMTQTITQLQQTMDSNTKNNVQQQMRFLVDHIAWRLFQLILVAFGVMLMYCFIKRKLKGT
jgi:hypothetical protein